MQSSENNRSLIDQNEQLSNIQARLCTLHKWSHYDGYGIHLSRDKHPLGLRIDTVESCSPAESGGLRRGDIILAVNSHSIENDDFFVILSCIQYALEQDQIRFLVLDFNSAELVQYYHVKIDENTDYCVRMETPQFIGNTNELSNNQQHGTDCSQQTITQNSSDDEVKDTKTLSAGADLDNNLTPELRMCSVILQSNMDQIGISLEPDLDFGHIITQVESDSPAARAGIEQNDYILSLNHTSLIYLSFEDVFYFLKKKRSEMKLDFLVTKKSYLLQSLQNHLTSNTNTDTIPSMDTVERTKSFTLPATQTYEQLEHNQQRQTNSIRTNKQYDQLSFHIYRHRFSAEYKKNYGNVLKGIGPVGHNRFSSSVQSQRTIDYSSLYSDLYERKPDLIDTNKRSGSMKASFNLLRVGMTNPSPKQQPRRLQISESSPTSSSDNGKHTNQLSPSIERHHNSSRVLPSSILTVKNNSVINTPLSSLKYHQTIRNILSATPLQLLPTWCIEEQDNSQFSQSNCHLITIPISELVDHGYELHSIRLMQATETIPLGFKLSKQTDSLQCVVTGIDQQSRADLAGLRLNDWLIKTEDNDIRSMDFAEISQNISQILNTAGSINLLIARKKSRRSSSIIDDQRMLTYDKLNETNALFSVGLSNKIEDRNHDQSIQSDYAIIPVSGDSNQDSVRHIILKEALGLDFYSFAPDKNSQIKLHAINNIRPLSLAYRAGLRNGDRILTVNNIDVTNTTHKTVRHRLLKKSPVHLTVINDPKYLELIETIKRNQNRITLSSSSSISSLASTTSNNESAEQQSSNLLSEDLINVLFIDDKGPVYMKHCSLKKEPTYDSMGFALRYIDHFHTLQDVEINMPAYNCGLRNEDVILYINKQNVERMTHDDVKILIRTLTLSNEIFNLILLNKNDMKRYKDYQEKSFIDWKSILTEINEDDCTDQAQQRLSHVNNLTNKPSESSASTLLSGARICILEPAAGLPAGFSISGEDKPPFLISKIDPDSPADKAGLRINDTLLSINGKSMIQTTYDETIEIIKQALQQKLVQIVVKQIPVSKTQPRKDSNQSSLSDNSEDSDDAVGGSTGAKELSRHDANPLHTYQSMLQNKF